MISSRLGDRRGQRLLDQHVHARLGQARAGRACSSVGRATTAKSGARRRRAARPTEASTSAGSCDGAERSPAGSTAPANARAAELCSRRAWWRPIMPRPSTAPRSSWRSDSLRPVRPSTRVIRDGPLRRRPDPGLVCAPTAQRRRPDVALRRATSSSTPGRCSATAASSQDGAVLGKPATLAAHVLGRRLRLGAAASSGRARWSAPGRSCSPARASARARSSATRPTCASARAIGARHASSAAAATIDNDVIVGERVRMQSTSTSPPSPWSRTTSSSAPAR